MKRSDKKQDELRFSYVMLGLILGFFLGSGVVYWYLNRQNGSEFYHKTWTYLSEWVEKNLLTEAQQPEPPVVAQQPQVHPARKATPLPQPSPAETLADTLSPDNEDSFYIPQDFYVPDSLENALTAASLAEEIRVMQDRLLMVRVFSIHNPASAQNEQYRLLDSLAGNTTPKSAPKSVRIEFWTSPLQYSGYKKSKNRVIIYGLEHPQLAQLQVVNSHIVLKYLNHVFLLADNDSFQPFIAIFDQEDLEQISDQ